jgi:tetratricopeptide (TPR) repeat protein
VRQSLNLHDRPTAPGSRGKQISIRILNVSQVFHFVAKRGSSAAAALLSALFFLPSAVAQQPPAPRREFAPPTRITVDGSEQLFTTMCALHAAGFEADVSASGWHPLRAQLRDLLRRQQGPAVDAVRQFYAQHELADPGSTLSRYIWFALVAGPPPNFAPIVRHEELPPEVLALEGFSEILANYYKEQNIHELWRRAQPAYTREIERLHEPVSQIVMVATAYLREILNPSDPRTFSIIVEPMVGRKTNVRNFGDHYAIILSGTGELPVDEVRHAFLHFLLDSLPLRYPHVVAVKRPLMNVAARAPRLPPELKDDFPAFFTECLVRAVELKLRRLAPSEMAAALDRDEANGFVLERALERALANFEKAEPSMTLYFPDLVRSIDTAAELKRLERVQFAAVAAPGDNGVEVTRAKRLPPTTVPNDPEILAALTEGERLIAEKNPRGAEAAFRRVVAKYPDQPRALYGLALVALLDGDGLRAQQLLGRLVSRDPGVAKDPMVVAWSHVYLARIYETDGKPELALDEYRAALAVEGAPELARQAAQHGLEKTNERPKREKP